MYPKLPKRRLERKCRLATVRRPGLQNHIYYLEDLFNIQAQEYRAYHTDAREVLYNGEDLCSSRASRLTPRASALPEGIRMASYYILMCLPDDARTEFLLMLPTALVRRHRRGAWPTRPFSLPPRHNGVYILS